MRFKAKNLKKAINGMTYQQVERLYNEQAKLVEEKPTSRQSIWNWANGKNHPSYYSLMILSKALKVDFNEFF